MIKFIESADKRPGIPDFYFYCPGCKCDHGVWVKKEGYNGPVWSFNGDMERPTVSPSLKITIPVPGKMEICHSFITDGKIQYLNDCTHELAGQTIELPEYE